MSEVTMEIERDDEAIEVTITGKFWKGCRGMKAHPMDRFAPPDDDPEWEILSVQDKAGNEVELTDEEYAAATEKLWGL